MTTMNPPARLQSLQGLFGASGSAQVMQSADRVARLGQIFPPNLATLSAALLETFCRGKKINQRLGQISPPNLATLAVTKLGGEIWPNLATLSLSCTLY